MTDIEQQSYAEIDLAVGVFRVCPKCHHKWRNEAAWRKDTEPSGTEQRAKRFTAIDSRSYDAVIELEVRRHLNCGGENYSRGKLHFVRLAPE